MNILEVLKACTMMIANGYQGVEIAGILRNVANEIDPKGAAAMADYKPNTIPTNPLQWQIFKLNWREVFKRNNPLVTRLDNVQKIATIKVVREMTGLGLKESKDFVDANWNEFMTISL